MTVLDNSVAHREVLMVLPRRVIQKEAPLAKGYRLRKYDDDLYASWIHLMDVTGLASEKEAGHILDAMLADRERFVENFLFVVDEKDNLAASAGLWPGHAFKDRLRLHWVATDPGHQHKGLSRALITRLAMKYDQMPSRYPLYLSTQSESWGAIMLYSRLGFTPYLGEYEDHTEAQSVEDWEFVTEILKSKAKN